MEEEWREIKYFSDYTISNLGRVKRIVERNYVKANRILKSTYDKDGYLHVLLYNNRKRFTKRVHRLVLQAFDSNYNESLQCNHKNGIKTDNRLENLEMVTCSENHKHAFKIGLRSHMGEKHNNSTIKNDEVWLIQKILFYKKNKKINIKNQDIAKMFKVNKSTIDNISCKHTWPHITYP